MKSICRINKCRSLHAMLIALICLTVCLSLALTALAETAAWESEEIVPEVNGLEIGEAASAPSEAETALYAADTSSRRLFASDVSGLPEYKAYHFAGSGFIYSDELLDQAEDQLSTDLVKASACFPSWPTAKATWKAHWSKWVSTATTMAPITRPKT